MIKWSRQDLVASEELSPAMQTSPKSYMAPRLGSVFTELFVLTSAPLFRQSYKNSQTFCFPGSADHNPSDRGHLTYLQHGSGSAQRAIQNLAYEVSSAAEMHYHLLHIHVFHHPKSTSCLLETGDEDTNTVSMSSQRDYRYIKPTKTNQNLHRLRLASIFK